MLNLKNHENPLNRVELKNLTFENTLAATGIQMSNSLHERIDPNGGFSRSLEKLMQNTKRVL
jgi:hypothetical protein